jgi:hypothetical protein
VVLTFFALSAFSINAQVTFYGVQKGPSYTQTTDNTPPATASGYGIYVFFNTSSPPGDETTFAVTDSDTDAPINATGSGTSFGGLSSSYPNEDAMNTDFPPGSTYSISVTGGSLDGQAGSLPNPQDYYPDQIYVTGSGITDALAINPNATFTLNVGYTTTGTESNLPSSGYNNYQEFAIFDPSSGFIYTVTNSSPGQSSSAFTVPSSFLQTLTAGDSYLGQLTDFNTYSPGSSGDFSGADVSDGFTQTTTFDFVVEAVPEPSQWGVLVFLGAVAAFGLRRMRAKVVSLR